MTAELSQEEFDGLNDITNQYCDNHGLIYDDSCAILQTTQDPSRERSHYAIANV